MWLRHLARVAVPFLFAACAPGYVYAPVSTTSADLEGAPAAVYEMPPGSHRGDVRLAMVGVASLKPGGLEDSTLRAIHVALSASNQSDEAWTIDPWEARLTLTSDEQRGDVYATTAEVTRPTTAEVPPRSTRLIHLYFPLPLQFQQESELPSFDVFWTVHIGSRAITQRTPFRRFRGPPDDSPSR